MQSDQGREPSNGDDVDSPTATANGPAVQPVSAEKAKKPGKAVAKQAGASAEGGESGSAAQEDPEKKAKKVTVHGIAVLQNRKCYRCTDIQMTAGIRKLYICTCCRAFVTACKD